MEKQWQSLLKTTVEGFHLSEIITKYLAAVITVIMDDVVQSASPESSLYYQKKNYIHSKLDLQNFPRLPILLNLFSLFFVKS